MPKPNAFLAAFLNTAARAGQAATHGVGRVPAQGGKGGKGGGCTPCAAMARRAQAEAHVRGLTGK